MIIMITLLIAIFFGFIGIAIVLFSKISDHLTYKDQEKEKALKEAEDKKKYPGSKPWI